MVVRLNVVSLYEYSLSLGALGVLLWFVDFMNREYGTALTRDQLLFILGSALVFTVLLWADVEPKSTGVKIKVILYGVVAGLVVGIGLVGWAGGWLPPIPE